MPIRFEHARRSIRLPHYDYTSSAAYFVTICACQREHLFGEIYDGRMELNIVGSMVLECWNQISKHFIHVEQDEFIVMPNHAHGILWIGEYAENGCTVGAQHAAPLPEMRVVPGSLAAIIRSFKSAVTKRVNETNPKFGPVWQRNYYERVIRSDWELNAIRQYIQCNPANWATDKEKALN